MYKTERTKWISKAALCLLLCCSLLFGYTDTIDTSLPAGTDDPREADDNIRRIQGGFQEILDVEHDAALTGTVITGDGTHTDITTDSIVNAGSITNAGTITTATTTVSGALTVTGIATIGDASLLATSAAPTADAMIANKKYVDDQDTADHPAYSGGESHTDGSGLIIKMGNYSRISSDNETVTFGTAFPNACITVVAGIGNSTGSAADSPFVKSISAANFTIYLRSNASPARWIAIGY